jgi:hypothetical protein
MTAHAHPPRHFHVPSVQLLRSGAMTTPLASVVTLLLVIAAAAMIVITLVAIVSVAPAWIMAPGPYPSPRPVPYPVPYPPRAGGLL